MTWFVLVLIGWHMGIPVVVPRPYNSLALCEEAGKEWDTASRSKHVCLPAGTVQ